MLFMDPIICCFEIAEITDNTSARINQTSNNTWLPCYQRPRKYIFDNGNDFTKDFLPLLKDFSIKHTPTSNKNPQANSILERVHQALGYMLRTKTLHKYDFGDMDHWSELLTSVAWAIRSTHHPTLQTTSSQLMFGRIMLLSKKNCSWTWSKQPSYIEWYWQKQQQRKLLKTQSWISSRC